MPCFSRGGRIAHYLFGVATASSVDEMRKAGASASADLKFQCTDRCHDLFIPCPGIYAMAVYRTHTLILPVAGSQQLITDIRNFPCWIIRDSREMFMRHLELATSLPVVAQSNVILRHRCLTSCLSAIMYDDHDAMRQNCDISAPNIITDPSFIKLNLTPYVLSNFVQLGTYSGPASAAAGMVSLGCSRSLHSAEAGFVAPMNFDNVPPNSTTLHIVHKMPQCYANFVL